MQNFYLDDRQNAVENKNTAGLELPPADPGMDDVHRTTEKTTEKA
jgi:hypothetical protein